VRFAGTDQNGHLALTDPGPESTAIRFFDPVLLVEIDELERRFDTGITSIRLDPTGTALLYVDDSTLVHQSASGESELGPGYIAAWFVR
jgi:hypothetical protein